MGNRKSCCGFLRRGYQFRAGFLDGVKREVITIYEIIRDAANNLLYAVPDYQFRRAALFPLGPFSSWSYWRNLWNCKPYPNHTKQKKNLGWFRWNNPSAGYPGPTTNCTAVQGTMPGAANGIVYDWSNTMRSYRSAHPACGAPDKACIRLPGMASGQLRAVLHNT